MRGRVRGDNPELEEESAQSPCDLLHLQKLLRLETNKTALGEAGATTVQGTGQVGQASYQEPRVHPLPPNPRISFPNRHW